MKPRLCRQCKEPFIPQTSQPWQRHLCKYECAAIWGREQSLRKQEKEKRADTKKRKAAIKTKPELLKTVQQAFNAWIRCRDEGKPCCACGEPMNGSGHASHYLSVGARPGLRLDPANCHLGCAKCNVFLHGNLINYRIQLIERIGLSEVERLENDTSLKNYTRDELIQMAADYRKKTRDLQRG